MIEILGRDDPSLARNKMDRNKEFKIVTML